MCDARESLKEVKKHTPLSLEKLKDILELMKIRSYQIELTPIAYRQIKEISRRNRKKLIQQLETLSVNPRSRDVKVLSEADNIYKIKNEDYRIIYVINDKKLKVLIAMVASRKKDIATLA